MVCHENLTNRYFIRNHHTVKFHTVRNISEKNQTNVQHRHSNQSFRRFQFLINSEKRSPKELSINFTGHTNVFLYSINTIFIYKYGRLCNISCSQSECRCCVTLFGDHSLIHKARWGATVQSGSIFIK